MDLQQWSFQVHSQFFFKYNFNRFLVLIFNSLFFYCTNHIKGLKDISLQFDARNRSIKILCIFFISASAHVCIYKYQENDTLL